MKHLYIMILVSILCFHANAQSSTTTVQQVDISLVNVITMTFVSTGTNTGSNININLSSMNNLQNGVTSTQQWLSVNSTKDFNVSAKCNATNFSYSGSYTQNTTKAKPCRGSYSGSVLPCVYHKVGSITVATAHPHIVAYKVSYGVGGRGNYIFFLGAGGKQG